MAPLSVTLDVNSPRVGILSLVGEHDAYSAGRIENELGVLLESSVAVVIDLTDATFIDSQTLSVLLGSRHAAEKRRLGFVLALPPEAHTQVHRILDMTGLGSSFAVEPSIERAVARARAGHSASDRLQVA